MSSQDASDDLYPKELVSLMNVAGNLRLRQILQSHPMLADALSVYDPIHSTAIFAGLLTVPDLQCNCFRLETLSHLSVGFCRGKRKPSKSAISCWFSEMSSGPCGQYEDAAEDAFTSVITTPHGNFRIIEGMWESAGFYLQRIVNVVNGMPNDDNFSALKRSVYAVLKLSDLICQRAALQRYKFGSAIPEAKLSALIINNLQTNCIADSL